MIGRPMALGLSGCLVLLAMLLAWPATEADAASSRVACFDTTFPNPGQAPAFEKKPRRCVFISVGALSLPVPPAFAVQSTRRVRWIKWSGKRAEGRGKAFSAVRKKPVDVRITLTRPVKRCGHRAYSMARFRFPQLGTRGEPLRLVTC